MCENYGVFVNESSNLNNARISNNKWYVFSYVLHKKEATKRESFKSLAVIL
jgi:hypothetical protein